jgi:hypothetical protein
MHLLIAPILLVARTFFTAPVPADQMRNKQAVIETSA